MTDGEGEEAANMAAEEEEKMSTIFNCAASDDYDC